METVTIDGAVMLPVYLGLAAIVFALAVLILQRVGAK